MDKTTYQYLKPTDSQMADMEAHREAARVYAEALDKLPDGPDKTYAIRKHREVAMWANICITRHADGSPRRTDAQ